MFSHINAVSHPMFQLNVLVFFGVLVIALRRDSESTHQTFVSGIDAM